MRSRLPVEKKAEWREGMKDRRKEERKGEGKQMLSFHLFIHDALTTSTYFFCVELDWPGHTLCCEPGIGVSVSASLRACLEASREGNQSIHSTA